MISQEKVKGWLVGYFGTYNISGQISIIGFVKRFSLVPAVFLTFANRPEGWGTLDGDFDDVLNRKFCADFHLRWKSEKIGLEMDEVAWLKNGSSRKIVPELQEFIDLAIKQYSDYEQNSLEYWQVLCNEYNKCLRYNEIDYLREQAFLYAEDFPESYANPGTVPAPISSLVCSELPMAPVDDVKVPMVAPAGSVSAFIQGEVVGIQGPVADGKRDTSLTEYKKQTGIQKEMLEVMKQIAENTENKPPKPQTRLETLRDTYLSYTRDVNQNTARYLMREKCKCEYEEIWKIEHWGVAWDAVDEEIKRQEIGNIRAGVSQARPKRP